MKTRRRWTLPILFLAQFLLPAQIQNQPDDNQWTMPAKNFASTRFSALSEVNTANVKDLKLDLTIQGRARKVLAHPDRNARMYILDCATGEVLSAEVSLIKTPVSPSI